MKTLVSILSEPVAVALGWTLLHALWQGFALVMPAALGMHLFRRNSSALRYNIGVSALLAQVISSVVTFGWYYQPLLQTARSSAKTVLTTAMSAPISWPIVSRSLPWHEQVQHFLEGYLTEIVVCWLVGVALFLVRLAGGWFYVQRLKTTAVQPADTFWQAGLIRLSTRLAVRQPVQILESMQVLVPMVVGALKPVILLPVGLAAGLSMREAEAILAHELAHIKRFDYAVNLLQSIVEVAFFFHPALWWLSARVREERENCCDDLAVLACGDARSLAQALARVEEFSQTPMLAMALASQKKLLLNRVRRMLGVSVRPVVSNAHLGMLTLATLLLTTISVYAMQEKEPQPKPRKTQPIATRRHKTPNGTEFGITDNRKVDYIVWKGRKLPAKRVAGLQRQLDKVMAGQLSLDAVAQPDRDILLNIIETNHSFKEGMSAVADGLAHIDYDNIVATTLNDASVNLDANLMEMQNVNKMIELQHINYNKIADEAIATAGKVQADYNKIVSEALTTAGQAQPMLHEFLQKSQGNADSLQAVREQNRLRAAQIRLSVEKQRFAADAIRRKIDLVSYEKMRVEQERLRQTMRQRQIMMKTMTNQSDSARASVEKQVAENERVIQQQEAIIEKNAQQLMELQNQFEQAQQPLREAETQLRKLGYTGRSAYPVGASDLYKAATQNTSTGQHLEMLEAPELPETPEFPEPPEVPGIYLNGSTRPLRAPVPPKSLNGMRISRLAPAPAIAPTPKVNARPARPAVPTVAPKPAISPKN